MKVFALTDYYEGGREHYRAWLLAAFGYDDTMVGSHAGISDTSQMLHVYPAGVRTDQITPWGGPKDSGVTGDPIEGDRRDRPHGHRVQGERRHRPIQTVEEPTRGKAGRGLLGACCCFRVVSFWCCVLGF